MGVKNEEFDDEIDLLQVFKIIKENFFLFAAICIITGALGFCFSNFLLDETFSATSKVIIVKDDTQSSSSTVTYTDVQLSQKLVNTYSEIIMSEAVSDEVINKLNLDKYEIDYEKYQKIVEAKSVNSTEVMAITVETNDPVLSANIANEIVNVFMTKIYEIMEIQNVTVLNEAKVPVKKSGPSNTKFALLGVAIGLVICFIIFLVKFLTDVKVKTEEEIKEIFPDYAIIGSIPNFEVKEEEYDD